MDIEKHTHGHGKHTHVQLIYIITELTASFFIFLGGITWDLCFTLKSTVSGNKYTQSPTLYSVPFSLNELLNIQKEAILLIK